MGPYKKFYDVVSPVYDYALMEQGANGDLIIYDDTPGRILEHQVKGLAAHTTAFVSVHEEHKTHLFFTGRNHAGKNVDAILDRRTNKNSVTAMMELLANHNRHGAIYGGLI